MNKVEKFFNTLCSHYNDKKYWKMKSILCEENHSRIIKMYCLFRMKKMEAFNCASLGNRIRGGSTFDGKPSLPHGIKGIFITDKAKIGKNCTIMQQVTIGSKFPGDSSGPTIGDNCFISAGAKIIGNITIGNNVKIGANCVVVNDVPDNTTVVLNKPRLINKAIIN